MTSDSAFSAPMIAPEIEVSQDWIDQNGHMNMANYLIVFDRAIDHFWQEIGLGPEYRRSENASTFTLQTQLHYLREVVLGDPLRVEFQLLGFDQKRIHCFQFMYHGSQNYLAATEERITLHVDMRTRKSARMASRVSENLSQIFDSHQALPKDKRVGSSLSLER